MKNKNGRKYSSMSGEDEREDVSEKSEVEVTFENGAKYAVALNCSRCYEIEGEKPVTVYFKDDYE